MFIGAKLALFLGGALLVIRRDDRPDIPFPDYWDFPGGGREGDETPEACALRETREEVGLILSEADLIWSHRHMRPDGPSWFFAAELPGTAVADIRFGDEGQGWRLMTPQDYCRDPMAIPHFVAELRHFLAQREVSEPDRKAPRV